MAGTTRAGRTLAEARRRAGLTQRALAERAGTAQSVVARIESGVTDPTTATLDRLLEAAGYEARWVLSPATVVDSHTLDDVDRILALSPEERLAEVASLSRFETAARRV